MDKSDLRRLTKQILIQEQKQILTENIACHVTDNPCKVGNCLFDPGTNSMCCVKDIAYGCMDGKVAKDDRRKTKGLGGGSGFKKPQGGSARLEKFNSRQKLNHAKEAKKFKMRESEIRRVKQIIKEQNINNVCDMCMVWYNFNPGSAQQNCMCSTCPCGTNPQTGPGSTNCEMCHMWYQFAPGSVQDECDCPTCPCGEGKKIPTTNDAQWLQDFEVDTAMGHTTDSGHAGFHPDKAPQKWKQKKSGPISEREIRRVIRRTLSEGPGNFACMGGVFQWGSSTCAGPGNYSMGQANVQAVFSTMSDCQASCGQEWACMGGPNANGCQQGPTGSFQIGQGGVMSIHNTQADCIGSCTSGFGWECNPSGAAGCVQTAAGPYNSMSQCVAACGSYGDDKYDCVNNSCIAISPTDPGYNSAPYITIDDCEDSMCGDRRSPIDDPRGPQADMPADISYARKGNSDMDKSRARARALSESNIRRLIRKSLR